MRGRWLWPRGFGAFSWRKSGLLFLLFIVVWFYTFTSFILFNGEPTKPESRHLQEKILDLSKRYIKAVAKEKGEGKTLPDPEGSYDFKKTLAVLIDNLLTRVDYLENKVNSLSVVRPSQPAPGRWLGNESHVELLSSQRLMREGVSSSRDDVSREKVDDSPVETDAEAERRRRHGAFGDALKNISDGKCAYTEEDLKTYPNCEKKIEWMKMFWQTDKCYSLYGVDGSDCSIFLYLSEVEKWCPHFSWRPKLPPLRKNQGPKAYIQVDKDGLFALMDSHEKFSWMKMRISRMWDTLWIPAVEALDRKGELKERSRKKILIHLGLLTKESGFKIAEKAFSGGPLGELVQWADIITSLYILGHDISLSYSTHRLSNFLRSNGLAKSSCPTDSDMPFDVVYIDIVGLKQMRKATGGLFNQFKCMLRVIDTFGTEPAYNADRFAKSAGYKSSWGKWNLVPRQFMTMFPHTPDNSFMGFVVEHYSPENLRPTTQRQNKALVYGKDPLMWRDANTFLNTIHAKFDIHGTVYSNGSEADHFIPSYVHNHGIVSGSRIQELLQETKLFVGLGFPYEGPAPLEAIANGCVFLNPSFNPPKNSKNTKFFEGKPTLREFSSQHPYAEVFIGKPHVWTVDISKTKELEQALNEISNLGNVPPLLPFEYTCEGMLQRVSAYVQHQDFCATVDPPWPPTSALRTITADVGVSCKKACFDLGLVCEPSFFPLINSKEALEKNFAISCSSEEFVENIYPPAMKNGAFSVKCHMQQEDLLYSCAGEKGNFRRLCPCRDYIKGQVALCKDCL
ncbi:Alpha-1,6-mannosylglycoprotein 6-beta-N-acetylglucosaminyltransferase A [Holothuria leucospilota]|uniref:alpha-1,6-mannosyl-glycoprotein 6-beta-N-acetylglucosaminyltransferase n=1 Tax=Holothuria leucospilota TaxID=206669 RepID=A0A9Q1B9M6_HOLLE|nr:Alpha-1,6-mannosylglycoprotein 6-beta-N-acetylglucosaminyltransferase A [Holothuria leucospilota]